MKVFKCLVFLVLICLSIVGCKKSTVVDNEDNFKRVLFNEAVVTTVQIGGQTWMAENLKVTVDSSGNRLNSVSCNGDDNNDDVYGRLYTLEEAIQACPPGWHLPTNEEYRELFDFLGGMAVAGGKMKTTTLWLAPNVGATNSSGFNAVPAAGGEGFGWACHFLTSSSDGSRVYMPSILNSGEDVYVIFENVTTRASVRYIKD